MNNSPWDRFVLLGAAVVVTGLSVLFVMKARGFGETFRMNVSSPNNELPKPDIAGVLDFYKINLVFNC